MDQRPTIVVSDYDDENRTVEEISPSRGRVPPPSVVVTDFDENDRVVQRLQPIPFGQRQPSVKTPTDSQMFSHVYKTLALIAEEKLDSDTSPREAYFFGQAQAAASALRVQMHHGRITATTIYAVVSNLFVLHSKLYSTSYQEPDKCLDLLRRILTTIQPYSRYLDYRNELEPIDWEEVFHSYIQQCGNLAPQNNDMRLEIPNVSSLRPVNYLGKGSFGPVYGGVHQYSNFLCAIKAIQRADLPENYVITINQIGFATKCPFLVEYFASFPVQNAHVLVMEYLQAVDLQSYLDECGTFKIVKLRYIAAQLYIAIRHLHLKGFIHRDIKPSHILIKKNAQIKLIDVDSSRPCVGHHFKRALRLFFSLTASEIVGDTPTTKAYVAPETYHQGLYGRASDFWAFGCTLYKLYTGHVLYNSPREIMYDGASDLPEQCEPDLKSFIDTLLIQHPDKRLGSTSYEHIEQHSFMAPLNLEDVFSRPALFKSDKLKNIIKKRFDKIDEESKTDSNVLDYGQLVDDYGKLRRPRYLTYISPLFNAMRQQSRQASYKMPSSPVTHLRGQEIYEIDSIDYEQPLEQKVYLVDDRISTAHNASQFICLEIVKTTPRFGKKRSFGFSTRPLKTLDGIVYHIVDRLDASGYAAKCDLLLGDLISAVDYVPVTEEPLDTVSPDKMTLLVLKENPFRIIRMQRNAFSIFHSCGLHTVRLEKYSPRTKHCHGFGFGFSEFFCWDDTTQEYVHVHIIKIIDPKIKMLELKDEERAGTPEEMISVGDVLYSFNKRCTLGMSKAELRRRLTLTRKNEGVFEFFPVSVFRRPVPSEQSSVPRSYPEPWAPPYSQRLGVSPAFAFAAGDESQV